MSLKLHRITQAEDYRRIMRYGTRVGGPVLVTHAVLRAENDPPRFGFIASKRVGNAVVRNLVTRRLKAIALELTREGLTGADFVFRAQPAAATTTFRELDGAVRSQVSQTLQRAAL